MKWYMLIYEINQIYICIKSGIIHWKYEYIKNSRRKLSINTHNLFHHRIPTSEKEEELPLMKEHCCHLSITWGNTLNLIAFTGGLPGDLSLCFVYFSGYLPDLGEFQSLYHLLTCPSHFVITFIVFCLSRVQLYLKVNTDLALTLK